MSERPMKLQMGFSFNYNHCYFDGLPVEAAKRERPGGHMRR